MYPIDLTVVMYHYVRDLKNSRYPQIKGLQTELFKEQIEYMKRHYHFVTVEDVIRTLNGEGNFTSPHSLLLTFDDAYSDHFNIVFPILYNEGIQGAFYVPVRAVTEHTVLDVNKIHFILASVGDDRIGCLIGEIRNMIDEFREKYCLRTMEYYFNKLAVANRWDSKEVIFVKRLLQVELPEKLRGIIVSRLFNEFVGIDEGTFSRELYMSVDQIKTMIRCGMHVGSHGYDHYWLGALTREKQESEIKRSVEFISEVGDDIRNWSICYPYGDYNQDTIDILSRYGCRLGLTCEATTVYAQNPGDFSMMKYTIPRLDTNDLPKDRNASVNRWYK